MADVRDGARLRSLYVCYLSLEDPLVHTQVVAYLAGLAAAGHTVHLLTFDPELTEERRDAFAEQLGAQGIAWHSLRYHKRPSLPATVYDAFAGAAAAARIVRRHRLEAIHARNHVPLATALIVRRLTGCRLIFDIRGLMADEYADAGRWKKGGVAYRLTRAGAARGAAERRRHRHPHPGRSALHLRRRRAPPEPRDPVLRGPRSDRGGGRPA